MLQFKLPATHFVRISAGEAQGFTRTVLLGRAAICGHKQGNCLQDSQRAGSPVVKVEKDVSSRRVSSIHAWRGR